MFFATQMLNKSGYHSMVKKKLQHIYEAALPWRLVVVCSRASSWLGLYLETRSNNP